MEMGRDDLTPALEQLIRNATPAKRESTLRKLALKLSNRIKLFFSKELNYDGTPMKSPANKPRPDGKFAESYKWRYRPGWRLLSEQEEMDIFYVEALGQRHQETRKEIRRLKSGKLKERTRTRRRIPVDENSKQLQDTGATIKSIDIMSVDCDRAAVGPKTGHGQKILKVHQENEHIPEAKRRKPVGISDEFADEAIKFAADDLMKGV